MWTLDFKPRAEGWQTGWGERTSGLYKTALVGPAGVDRAAKCSWCEQYRSPRGELNVDHLRPKSRLTTWRGDPSEVSDTPPHEELVNDTGYWWLAFTWTNWNLACRDCNSRWKRNILPRMGPHQGHVEGIEESEVILLLDPTSDFKTGDHFEWDENGYMRGLSEIGRATIITCGLNRQLLRTARHKEARNILQACESFKTALGGGHDEAMDRTLNSLCALIGETAEFAGMARDLVTKRLEIPWENLLPDA